VRERERYNSSLLLEREIERENESYREREGV
jgi:hypothetical protein